MRIAVTYHSRTGNTRKLAEAIAEAAGCTAVSAAAYEPYEPVDLLFVGGAIYGGRLNPLFAQCIERYSPEKIRCAAVFSTYSFGERASAMIADHLQKQGISVAEEHFACKGKFVLLGLTHPNKKDLGEAKRFAAAVLDKYASASD